MSHPEHLSGHQPEQGEPLVPNVLPPDLAEFLRGEEIACIAHATNQGTVLVMKMPGVEIESVRGTVPILIRQELYNHPSAPVIRLVVTIYDQPERPMALELFFNIDDEEQRATFAALADQSELPMLLYDETLAHQLTKVVPYRNNEVAAEILDTAERILAGIPKESFNFDEAKVAVMEASGL